MIFISLVLTVILQWAIFRRRPFSDAIWVVFIVYLYYAFFVPILIVTTHTYDIWLVNQPIWVSDSDINLTAILNVIGYVGFALGYEGATRTRAASRDSSLNLPTLQLIKRSATLRLLFWSFVLIIFVIMIAFRLEFFEAISSYDSKIETNYDNSNYGYAVSTLFLFASFIGNYFILNSDRPHLYGALTILLFIMVSFLVYSKQPFVFAFLASVCLMSRYRKISPFAFSVALSIGIVVALVYLVPVFAAYRATGEISVSTSQTTSSAVIASDAIGPYGVTVYAFKGYVRPDGHPLWQSLMLWVPRAVWPGRPLDFGEDFARQMIVGWRPGFGLAFSPLAEAYVRLGLWGSAFFMALCGATIGLFQRIATWFMPGDARTAVALTLASTLTVVALRSPFSAIITQGMQMIVPVIFVGVAAWQFQHLQDRFLGAPAPEPAGEV